MSKRAAAITHLSAPHEVDRLHVPHPHKLLHSKHNVKRSRIEEGFDRMGLWSAKKACAPSILCYPILLQFQPTTWARRQLCCIPQGGHRHHLAQQPCAQRTFISGKRDPCTDVRATGHSAASAAEASTEGRAAARQARDDRNWKLNALGARAPLSVRCAYVNLARWSLLVRAICVFVQDTAAQKTLRWHRTMRCIDGDRLRTSPTCEQCATCYVCSSRVRCRCL